MGQSESKRKKGGEWEGKVYFDPESDKGQGPHYNLSDSELRDKLYNLIDCDEEIKEIRIYGEKLFAVQITAFLMYHSYVVLETNQWWWSLEKNGEGITIQRSKQFDYVKRKYRRKERNGNWLIESDTGRMTMKSLVDWLYENDELNRRYDVGDNDKNCKGFAKRVFDKFAQSKYWS